MLDINGKTIKVGDRVFIYGQISGGNRGSSGGELTMYPVGLDDKVDRTLEIQISARLCKKMEPDVAAPVVPGPHAAIVTDPPVLEPVGTEAGATRGE